MASAAAGAPAPGRARLEARFEAAMTAHTWPLAAALGDSLVRAREAREGLAPLDAASVLDSLGLRLFRTGDPEAWAAAEPLFRAGLARRERARSSDDPGVASSLATLSTLLDYLGRWSDAVPLAERAVSIRARVLGEQHASTAASLRQLGLLRFQLGDYEGAEAPLERALVSLRALPPGSEASLADAYNNLGELARVRDRLDAAEARFQGGLQVARAALQETHPLRLALENNLAGVYKDVGRLDEAEPLLERVLAEMEKSPDDREGLATARLNLAEVRRLQGRAAEAAPLYASAVTEARAGLGEGHPALILFLNQAAACDQELGQFARADSLFGEAAAIVEATVGAEHPEFVQILVDRARLQLAAGRAAAADTLLLRALAAREHALGPTHPEVGATLVERARVLASSGASGAERFATLDRAIAILGPSRMHPEARLDAHALRADAWAQAGQLDRAIADLSAALAIMDSLRGHRGGGDRTRAGFIASRLGLVDQMVGWQLERGDAAAALAAHERGRARVLLDQIAAGGVAIRAGIPEAVLAPLLAEERAAEARLAAAQRGLQDARRDPSLSERARLDTLAALAASRDSSDLALALARRRIEDASPLWRRILSSEGRFAPVSELQKELVPEDGRLLVYHVGPGSSRVFELGTKGEVRAWTLAVSADAAAALGIREGPLGEAALARVVSGPDGMAGAGGDTGLGGLLSGTRAGGFVSLPLRSEAGVDSFEVRLHALWRVLVPAPLWATLQRSRIALVVPDGPLQQFPFEALVIRTRATASSTRYWLDEGPAIAYGPSASSLLSLARRSLERTSPAATRAGALSVSNVQYAAAESASIATGRRFWAPLPATSDETAAIVAAFGAREVSVLSGDGATESRVRDLLPRYPVVHLATHAYASPTAAGLVFAPPAGQVTSSEDDGVLELFEIHGLSLHCRLAVLSACETARGPQVAGEGALALSRGFLAAGARQVVGSLWAVDDRATAPLMATLFERIASDESKRRPVDVALALRDAKRAVRRESRWADPFYWSPFVLSGR